MPAIYHLSIKIFSRGKGRSAVAGAAYRAAELIKSEYDGIVHDYTRKSGVVHKEILLPENAPAEYFDRATLWNAVEMAERYKTAQLSREVEIALPAELSREENIQLARQYVQENFVNAGMCADLCVHDKGDGNPHAHIMLTMRPIEKDGKWGQKSRTVDGKKVPTVDWNDQSKAEEWRSAWADVVNDYFKQQGSETRIDHRSYKRQGKEQVPTIHMGVAASQMEKRDVATERGNINRDILVTNQEIRQLRARINKVKNWLYTQPITNAPSLVDMMNGIAGGYNLKTRWQKIRDLQTQARVLIFLQNNKIDDVEQLADRVTQMHEQLYEVSNKIKSVDRRLGTLAQHLAQYENYKKHKAVYQKYQQLAGKKGNEFYDKHFEEILLYQDAKKYLDGVMNGRTAIPVKVWEEEQEKVTAERFKLCDSYYKLKGETKDVEVLQRSADRLMQKKERDYQSFLHL